MSTPVRDPNFIGGTPRSSGDVQTGELPYTFGGGRCASIYSGNAVLSGALVAAYGAAGTGYDVVLYSGPGRLKTIQPHVQISGVAIAFYDAAAVASGGPFAASGVKILGTIPANTWALPGGVFATGPAVYQFDMPFQSGLAVALKSGQPGFTVSWTPECSILDNGSIVGA